MKRFYGFLLSTLLVCMWLGCGGNETGKVDGGDGGVVVCDLINNPCPTGQRCTKDRECVNADRLTIVTESLPNGRVGYGYNEQVEATGGLPPYTWDISQADPELAFLSINSLGRLQGTTSQAVQGASLTVAVTDDGYLGGESVSKTYTISFDICREGDIQLCYAPKAGACYQGYRSCVNGQMGACETGTDPSMDVKHCGSDCTVCDGSVSDICSDGLCACGIGSSCDGGSRCCGGLCIDVSSNIEHCGSCNSNCQQMIAHASASSVFCVNSACDYTGPCDLGWLDCDSRKDNGCEQPVGVYTCGACNVDCTTLVAHVSTSQKICVNTTVNFQCDYTGNCANDFGDCDGDRSNGCETYFNNPQYCGGCGVDCSQAPAGHLCLSPEPTNPYYHTCGCRFDSASGLPEGCEVGQICCDRVCRDAATDLGNCGVCQATCITGVCVDAACGCAIDDDCPIPSGAVACGGNSRCICPTFGAGATACSAGQYCCDGLSGGSGGPEEGQDTGCCPKICSQNDVNHPCTP